MRAKKFTLMSRAQVARTQKQVNEAITGMCSDNASKGFVRMEEKVMRMEAEAEMSGQWRTAKLSLDPIDDRFKDTEMDEIAVELALRKEKLGNQKAEIEGTVKGKESEMLNN